MKNSVQNSNVVVEVVETTNVETLEQKIARLKAEFDSEMKKLKEQEKQLKDQAKALKEESDKAKKEMKEKQALERAEKMKLLLANQTETKVNKSQVIREMMLQGCSKEQIVEKTGYSNKFVLDNMWRIEKAAGLR